MTLYIFNPEHDLCLANGDPNYVPPASATCFARQGKQVMNILAGGEAMVTTADDCADWRAANPDATVTAVSPWGWDMRIRNMLLKSGINPLTPMPNDAYIHRLRQFQHRTSILTLQSHALCAKNVSQVEQILTKFKRIVLKDPLSGSGRGLRWVDHTLTSHDIAWVNKVISRQGCVIVEQRIDVSHNFAYEFFVSHDSIILEGLSLFEVQSGVYRHNSLLPDSTIRDLVGLQPVNDDPLQQSIQHWIADNLMPWYEGPVGFDIMRGADSSFHVSEMNLRCTMGLVAHRYLQQHPESKGQNFNVSFYNH